MTNTISKPERAGLCLGVEGRFFGIVTADNGRILNQKFEATRYYSENRQRYCITAELRFDDEHRNGHETFAITADIRENGREYMGGCCHDEIARRFPEFAPLIKWHLVSTDGPMHYVANTVYHADEHGPTHAWVYFDDPANGIKKQCMKYCKMAEAVEMCLNKGFNYVSGIGYRYEADPKTAKTRNLDHARSCAVWPEATDEELAAPDLADKLHARLPALLDAFKADMLRAGFVFPEHAAVAA